MSESTWDEEDSTEREHLISCHRQSNMIVAAKFWNSKVHYEVALIARVDSAQGEYQSLSQENQMLQKYINNSLTSTAVFGATGGAIGNLNTEGTTAKSHSTNGSG